MRSIGHLTDASLFRLTSSEGHSDPRSDHRAILSPERSGLVLVRAAIEFHSAAPIAIQRAPAAGAAGRKTAVLRNVNDELTRTYGLAQQLGAPRQDAPAGRPV